MSMLVVEDNPSRIRLFRRGFIGVCITTVNTSDLAISWLNGHTPSLICLDYDLDQFGISRSESGTGQDVARFIAREHKRFARTLIIVHSLNEVWAPKMVALLRSKGLTASRHPNLWEESRNMELLAQEVANCEISVEIPA